MNIMIVEDELDILLGIRRCLDREPAWRIHAYDNAEDALVDIRRIRPEIIITDIVLPRMSGLDLIVESKRSEYQPKIVVISSYSSFDYAQRSLKLGAIDYLLKPIDVNELARKIDSLAELIREETRQSQSLENQDRMTRLGTQYLKEKFALDLCMKTTALQEYIYHRLHMWDLTWLCEKSFVVVLFNCQDGDQPLKESELELRRFAVRNIVTEMLEGYPEAILFENVLRQWVIMTSVDEQAILPGIRQSLRQYQRYEPVFGISERMHAFESISQAYKQAAQAFRQAAMNKEAAIVHYRDLHVVAEDDPSAGMRIPAIVEAVQAGDRETIDRCVKAVIRAFVHAEACTGWSRVMHLCYTWLIELHAELSVRLSKNFNESPVTLWKSIDGCGSIGELEATICAHLQSIAEPPPAEGHHFIIERTKKILNERFGEAVIQQKIASELEIHPVWLSQLFKKETGRNFLEHLTEVRMERAKELLRDSNYKIYEIANMIGYQDIQYFGKTFKKWTGFTPREYRYGK